MATSKALNTNNSNIKYTISVTQNSQNVSANTSSVTVSVRCYRTNTGYTTYGTGTCYCKINGTTYSAVITTDDKITSSGIVLFSRKLDIAHNSDGTKTLSTSAWISHQQFSSSEQAYSQTLTTIPRATAPTLSSSSINMNSAVTISTPRASSSFTHTLTYSFNGATGTIATGVATSYSWTIPLNLASRLPNGTSGSGTIICKTYNGSTLIGEKSVGFTAKVPASVVPSISNVVFAETVSGLAAQFSGFVQNRSKVKITTTAVGAYSSTIKTYKTTVNGVNYSTNPCTTGTINKSGNLTVSVTVTDSRGRTATTTKTLTLLAYTPAKINSFAVERSNADGTLNDNGEYLKAFINFAISSVSNKNTKTYKIQYRLKGTTTYTDLVTKTDVYSLNGSYVSTVKFATSSSYDIRLQVTDFFGSAYATTPLSTAFTTMNINADGTGVAFGKMSEKEGVEFGMKAYFNNGEIPAGAIFLPSGANLNNYTEVGFYIIGNTTISPTILNKPSILASDNSTGFVEIVPMGDGAQRMQTLYIASKTNQYKFQRIYYSGTWGEWFTVGGCTDWRDLTIVGDFEVYSSGAQPKYRVNGNLVTVTGAVKPTATITSNTTGVNFASGILAIYRPPVSQQFICQGSGINRWLLSVNTDGTLSVSRYGANAYVNMTAGTWLTFTVTYSI